VAVPKVIVAIAAILLLVHVQCVGACTVTVQAANSSSVPPCHKQHSHSDSSHNPGCCTTGIAAAPIVQPDATQFSAPVMVSALAVQAVAPIHSESRSQVSNSFDTSPPLLLSPSITILRV
jgi:hypothetical protein